MADTKHYTELGLVNTKNLFKKAMEGGYAIPAFNFNNMEQLQGIIIGCAESKSPVILQVSGSARKYADPAFLPYMAMGAVQTWGVTFVDGTADDWFRADTLIFWHCNPVTTRMPDVHFATEARYNGTRIVTVSPDFSPTATRASLPIGNTTSVREPKRIRP